VTSDYAINFLQLAIRTCQRGNGETSDDQRDARNAWVRLQSRYRGKSLLLSGQAMTQARSLSCSINLSKMLIKSPLRFLGDCFAAQLLILQACATLGNVYFGIPLPRAPANPLQDMMASLFGGGPPGGAADRGGTKRLRSAGRLD
jgi:hypothetical protein